MNNRVPFSYLLPMFFLCVTNLSAQIGMTRAECGKLYGVTITNTKEECELTNNNPCNLCYYVSENWAFCPVGGGQP